MNNRVRSYDSATPSWNQGGSNHKNTPGETSDAALISYLESLSPAGRQKKIAVMLRVVQMFEPASVDKLVGRQRDPARAQTRPTVHKNFFLINMSQHEQKKLRALVSIFGMELRGFLSMAVRLARRDLEQFQTIAEGAHLDPRYVWQLTGTWHSEN